MQGSQFQLSWNGSGTSAYELVYEYGTVGALKSGSTRFLRYT